MFVGTIICSAAGIAMVLIVYLLLPYLREKKRQEEHQREIEEAIKRHDEWTLVELKANLMALESEMMRGEKDNEMD